MVESNIGERNSTEERIRIAIINADRCKPKKCKLECKKMCPINKTGKLCIEVTPDDKLSKIAENLCIGCGLCVKKCPFEAIYIINLPKNLSTQTSHRYGPNAFKLHRLPFPQVGQILGLVGTNGIGKSTALKILAGEKPNLGDFENPPDWNKILKYYKGTELYNFFKMSLSGSMVVAKKPQHVDDLPKSLKGSINKLLAKVDKTMERAEIYRSKLDIDHIQDREIDTISGGELQRFAITMACSKKADVFLFDEPTSYLDIKQRLYAADAIRSLNTSDNYIIAVEHDLSVLDYLSDSICVLYGVPTAYGVVTLPYGVREGINVFLDGFIPTENMRFRDYSLNFKITDNTDIILNEKNFTYKYPAMTKQIGDFKLTIEEGGFTNCEIVVLLGENGTGKTTFVNMIAGKIKPDTLDFEIPELSISVKPQTISPKFDGTVQELLSEKLGEIFYKQHFISEVIKPLTVDKLYDLTVKKLSGGELQRVALVLALGKSANVYLIDEPSAFLDSEQRVIASKLLKRFTLNSNKSAFVVEHDFIMATYLADKVIVYDGLPAIETTARAPVPLVEGMNKFLKLMNITFRRDKTSYRPRINKRGSVKDQEQKKSGTYFYVDDN